MAGKSSVVINFIGDTTSLDKAVGHARTTTGKFGALVSGMGAKIGGEFGEIVSVVGDSFEKLGEKGTTMGQKLMVGGAAVTGLGVALQQMGSANKQAEDQLKQAIENTGQAFDDFEPSIRNTIAAMQDFGHSDDDTQNALQTLTQATNDPKKALDEMGLVADLAAAKHISLADSAQLLAKVLSGKGQRTLTGFGISLKKNKDGTVDVQAALDQLSGKLNGQASAATDNFAGRMGALRAKVTDFAAELANKVGPAITALGPVLMAAGLIMQTAFAKAAATAVASAATSAAAWVASTAETIAIAAMMAASWIAEQIAMGVASVAAAGAALAGWVAANIAMIAATLGIGLAIAAIVAGALWLKDHWREVWAKIKEFAAAAWNWIKDHWQLILAIITGPIGLAVLWIKNNWSTVTGLFANVIAGVKRVLGGVYNIITAPFRAAFNAVAGFWNNTLGGVSFKIPDWVPGIGGNGFSFPHINGLANGGTLTSSGSVMVGERGPEILNLPKGASVVPLGRGGAGGGQPLVGSLTVINYHPVSAGQSITHALRQTAFLMGATA